MGRYRNHRSRTTKNKSYSKKVRTRCRPRDLDQVQDDLKVEAIKGKVEVVDEDLPGLGRYHCTHCARYFIDETTLEAHLKTKGHTRRVKMTEEKQYSQDEADFGAGKSKEILPPAHGQRTSQPSL